MVKFPLPENIVKVTNRNQKGKCITVENGNICLKNILSEAKDEVDVYQNLPHQPNGFLKNLIQLFSLLLYDSLIMVEGGQYSSSYFLFPHWLLFGAAAAAAAAAFQSLFNILFA